MRTLGTALTLAIVCVAIPSAAAETDPPPQPPNHFVQSDNLGMNMWSHDFTSHKTTTVSDSAALSQFVGLHYFFLPDVRVGMNMQFTEILSDVAPGQSRFKTFALLPQVGWNFYGPFFAAFIFTFAPRTNGHADLDMGVQGLVGAGIPLTRDVKLSLALEVPYNFYIHQTIGLTPLAGVSVRL
jgi:hypothetical protein